MKDNNGAEHIGGNIPLVVNGGNIPEVAVNGGNMAIVDTINIIPGHTLTLVNGLNGPVNITNGLGEGSITLNIQNHLTPCTITSFADHFDIQPLGNGADANGANTGELGDF